MPDIKVDLHQLSKFAKALEQIANKAVPHAMRNTLNGAAFEARSEFNKQLGQQTTLRNTFTTRGTVVDKARGTDMGSMRATVGNLRPYAGGLEEGHTNRPRSGKAVAVPTPSAAGQSGSGKRTKTVRRRNRMSSIHLPARLGRTPQQQNAVAIRRAAASGGTAYLSFGSKRGIFRVTGGAKRKQKIVMLYDLSHHSTTVKGRHVMAETLAAIMPRLPAIAAKALEEQLRRYGAR